MQLMLDEDLALQQPLHYNQMTTSVKLKTLLDSLSSIGEDIVSAAGNRDKVNELYQESTAAASNGNHDVDSFRALLRTAHDIFVSCDSILRSVLIRMVRLLLKDNTFCSAVVEEEFHWLLSMSLERDHEFVQERMQGLKCMRRFIEIDPAGFPISFARSLVAVASNKDDNIRRVCLETLRELIISNPEIVIRVNGLTCLLDAIIEPTTQDMSESILLSVLYLMNDPKSRKYLRPSLDLRVLLSPLTDLDCEDPDWMLKCRASKSAIVTMLRTWPGVVCLATDALSLGSLVAMLRDGKVSLDVQGLILDAFNDVLDPVFSSVSRGRGSNDNGLDAGTAALALENPVPTPGESSSRSSTMGRPAGEATKAGFSLFSRVTHQASSGNAAGQVPFSPQNRKRTSTAGAISSSVERMNAMKTSDHGRTNDFDPLFNGLDNYAALVCCAFIHCGLIDALCCLGTHGAANISRKARELLLNLLRVVGRIFPDKYSSDLLTLSGLIELSTSGISIWSGSVPSATAAYRASQVLISVADVFTTSLASMPMHAQSRSRVAQPVGSTAGAGTSAGSSATGGTAGNASGANASISSKFVPLSAVRNLRDLVLEMKASSSSLKAGRTMNSRFAFLDELSQKLRPLVDRIDFKRQMEMSRVVGKEGKEPFRWDWETISDMLKHSFSDSERLGEALETKWVKRVSGFYRCSADEKGYFANLEWDPANLFYLECACDLYSVLVSYENGISFLSSDRRGMLFVEMAAELEQLVCADRAWVGSVPKNMFRLASVSQFMIREFFTLVGRMCASKPGRRLLDSTSVFNHLSCLGSYKQLDYLSRLVLTGLTFTDRGFLSQNLIQIWTSSDSCSHGLRAYIHDLLLALLRAHPEDFLRWGVNVICKQLLLEEQPSPGLVRVMEEAVQDVTTLRALIQKRPNVSVFSTDSPLLIRMLAVPEGIEYLQNKNCLPQLLDDFELQMDEYPLRFERAVARALSKQSGTVGPWQGLQPIVVSALDTAGLRVSDYCRSLDNGGSSILANEALDLEGLLRTPWAVEVKLSTPQSQSINAIAEYLRMDTFVDISELASPASSECIGERERRIMVRAMVLDGRGLPTAYPIAANKILQSCLLVGVCGVNRKGVVGSCYGGNSGERTNERAQRRKSATTNVPATQHHNTGRESLSGRSRPSITTVELEELQPVTSVDSHQNFDWSFCKPNHRQTNVIKMKDNRFAVEVGGEPVRWIFSGSVPGAVLSAFIEGHPDGSNRVDASRTGGFVYLVEVQYHLRFDTGLPKFVCIPRHVYGEMSRSSSGLRLLRDRDMFRQLLSIVRDDDRPCVRRRAALWSLGQIGSSDAGCEELLALDSGLLEWCVQYCCTGSNFALRSTAFHVLGLFGRSKQGMRVLQNLQWDVSPFYSNSAVAFPRDPSQLFQLPEESYAVDVFDNEHKGAPGAAVLKPFSTASSAEAEVLNLIAKLPGVIMYSECKSRLEGLRLQRPELFDNRALFIAVLKVLDAFTFKLSARRDIVNLFSAAAKMRNVKS